MADKKKPAPLLATRKITAKGATVIVDTKDKKKKVGLYGLI